MSTLTSLSNDELDALLKAAEGEPLHMLLFETAFRHGLRVSEVLSLTPANVQCGVLVVRRLKGSRQTAQPASRELIALAASRKAGEKLFPLTQGKSKDAARRQADRLMKRYSNKVGLPAYKAHMHAFKHTCATMGIEGGMKLNEIQCYLGHKSGASTMRYMEVSQEAASKFFAAAVLRGRL